MHHAGYTMELDRTTLVPGWRKVIGDAFHQRSLPIEKLEVTDHPRGVRVTVSHDCSEPCPWDVQVFEHAALDAKEALRKAWDSRAAALPGEGRFVVFYSWQSASPRTNRNLIEGALEKAVKALKNDEAVIVEPVIDRDTKGVSGSPDISATIFGKIEKASCFVADVSLVLRDPERASPNPNVLVELGFAAHALGWDRIICVVNKAFGPVEELPFDLRGRRVVTYSMADDEKPAAPRAIAAAGLEDALRDAVGHGIRNAGMPSKKVLIERILAIVSKENASSYAPIMIASTIRYPGVSREEARQRLHATMALRWVPNVPIPDIDSMQTGACRGEIVHLVSVSDDLVFLEIPPKDRRVAVPLDQVVSGPWHHQHALAGMKLGLTIVIPEDASKPLTLESE